MNLDIDHLVTTAAKRYKRRCWWADFEDLRQVGYVWALRAQKNFDPRVGVEPERYIWRAIVLQMQRALWADSAPVSGGKHRPQEALRGLHRTSLAALAKEADEARPDAEAEAREWRGLVRERLQELADAFAAEGAVEVLLEEQTAPAQARKFGVEPRVMYQRAMRLRAAASRSADLYDLMKDRTA